ncbi:MAG: arsenate reductase ArsC [Ignavibacteria bacterium]|nr:arsenate reductase ArsC [Ignavibacteria bacterium]
MNKIKVLFVCIHNSARSQMAEAFLNNLAGDKFEAHSAGIEPGVLNPLVVESMAQTAIDISKNKTKSVFDLAVNGNAYDYVITVCEKEAADKCPVFPGAGKKIQWSFNDPSKLTGSKEEKLSKIAVIRDEIKSEVEKFIKSL